MKHILTACLLTVGMAAGFEIAMLPSLQGSVVGILFMWVFFLVMSLRDVTLLDEDAA